MSARPELTRLHTALGGLDPDTTSSWIPYEKGYLFLRLIEETVGRGRFDPFFRLWFARNAFTAVTTDDFLAHLRAELPGALTEDEIARWVEGPGLPDTAPLIRSLLLDQVDAVGRRLPEPEDVAGWVPEQWAVWLGRLVAPDDADLITELDDRYGFSSEPNLDLRGLYLQFAVGCGHAPAIEGALELVARVGRMKYLAPLYEALVADPRVRDRALAWYRSHRERYHPIAVGVVEARLAAAGAPVGACR